MKGKTTYLDLFKTQALSKKCRHGFGPAYCSSIMCDYGNKILECFFVQEWIMLNKQAISFNHFWRNVIKTE